jgi:hypothetical protein
MHTCSGWCRVIAGLLGAAIVLACPAIVQAADRVALVIGNGAYVNATQLPNPPNDAADMAKALRDIGFDVVEGIDLDRRGMEERIREFGDRVAAAKVALFFYAGHGLQVAGKNYLVPVNAKLERPGHLDLEALDVQVVLAQMEAQQRVNLVFLDACRDNPLARSLASSLGATRSAAVGRGLASIQSAVGTMIAFATQPDAVALDGRGRNSPFTAALIKHIREPGVDIAVTMRKVRTDVLAATNQQQVPWDHSSLTDAVVLVPGERQVAPAPPVAPPPPAPARPAVAMRSEPPPRAPRPTTPGENCATLRGATGTDRYCASSVLAPQFGNDYGVRHLFSNSLSEAWVEGRPGNGLGEWVTIDFPELRLVRAIIVRNGYQKNGDIFRKNGRVRRLRMVFSQGETQTVTLQDGMDLQTIQLERPVRAYWVQFVIDDVFPGSTYTDTALTKLFVTSEPAPQ